MAELVAGESWPQSDEMLPQVVRQQGLNSVIVDRSQRSGRRHAVDRAARDPTVAGAHAVAAERDPNGLGVSRRHDPTKLHEYVTYRVSKEDPRRPPSAHLRPPSTKAGSLNFQMDGPAVGLGANLG